MFELPSGLPDSGSVDLTLGSWGSTVELSATHPLGQGQTQLHFEVEAGRIVSARAAFGSGHRGDEKLLEVRDFRQGLSLMNRHNWLTPIAAEIAYAQACEELMGLTPPARAIAIRELVLALQTATGWLQLLAGVDANQDWLRPREELVELTEQLTGARVHVSCVRLGGVASDVTNNDLDEAVALIQSLSFPAADALNVAKLSSVLSHLEHASEIAERLRELEGPFAVTLPKVVRVPVGNAYAECNATTGTVGVWLHSDGGKTPMRVALKSPSLLSVGRWEIDAVGKTISSAIEELLHLPLCYGEIER